MSDVYGSMHRLMDSPWFFVVVGLFVVLALVPLVATRVVAHREEHRDDRPRSAPDDDHPAEG